MDWRLAIGLAIGAAMIAFAVWSIATTGTFVLH
jgi:hypothetical protein